MARVKRQSFTAAFLAQFDAAVESGIHAMGELLLQALRDTLNVQGDRRHTSEPGQPPRRQTGRGIQSCRHEHDAAQGTSRVGFGSNAKHLYIHERGRTYSRKRRGRTRSGRVVPEGERFERRASLGPTFAAMKSKLAAAGVRTIRKNLSKKRVK